MNRTNDAFLWLPPPGRFIGFTGTQHGMTEAQWARVQEQTELCWIDLSVTERADRRAPAVHGLHGNCIGADEEFDAMCCDLGMRTYSLPCTIQSKQSRATKARALARPAPPLDRNRVIVAIASGLVAAPKTKVEEVRSGTWATVRYARKRGIPIALCFPDGTVKHEGDYQFEANESAGARLV